MRIACWFICFVLASSSLALAQTAFKNATNDWLMLSGVSQTSAIRRRAPTDAAAFPFRYVDGARCLMARDSPGKGRVRSRNGEHQAQALLIIGNDMWGLPDKCLHPSAELEWKRNAGWRPLKNMVSRND